MVLQPIKIKINKEKIKNLSSKASAKKLAVALEYPKDKEGNICFDFAYISKDCVERAREDSFEASNDDIYAMISYANKEINDYENFLFIKFWYKAFKYYLEKLSDGNDYDYVVISDFIPMFFQVLKRTKSPFSKFKIFKNFSPLKMEKQLTQMKIIQRLLKASIKNTGFPTIEASHFCKILGIKKIISEMMQNVIVDCEKFFKNTDVNKLTKSYYSENFDTYIKLINLDKQSDLYTWVVWHFYAYLKMFNCDLPDSTSCLEGRFPMIPEIKEYSDFLTSTRGECRSYKNMGLDELFLKRCWTKYSSQEALIDEIVPKIKTSKLTAKDFVYVNEYSYIKDILVNAIKEHKKGVNILLYGKPGTGKTELARTLIKESGANGYEVIENARDSHVGVSLDVGFRNNDFAAIRRILKSNENAIILYDEAEDFFYQSDRVKGTKSGVNYILEDNPNPVIWTTNNINGMEESFIRRFSYICQVEYMTKPVYKRIYKKLSKEYNVKYSDRLFNFCFVNRVSVGIIKKAFENYKLTKTNDVNTILEDINNTLEINPRIKVKKNTENNRPSKFNPKLLNTSDNLEEFCKKIVKLQRFDFSLLLYGVSGAGKSFYAEYLAEQLGMPILKKKASDLESMWVGETEKNIAAAFEEAKREKAVLVIDEGDHFISERSNHRATWETSRTEEMLQQIEAHGLPVIFTTNLMSNIDKAAMRRFTYKTKFDYLTSNQVKIAWKDYFPKAKLPTEIHLSRICPGDFATVRKKAEFEDYLTDTSLLYSKLEEEMQNKKEMEDSSIRF